MYKIYISSSTNPYYNMALENWLFETQLEPLSIILYFWINKPCIIIGHSQNPWRECNMKQILKNKIPIIRRNSGGGSVYHDLGNLNYSIMSINNNFDKMKNNLDIIMKLLQLNNIQATIKNNHSIYVPHNNILYKISGNAFRKIKDRSLTHGTLLINTDLSKIYDYLHHEIDKKLYTNSVSSIRSLVINITTMKKNFRCDDIYDTLKNILNNPEIHYLPQSFNNDWIKKEKNKFHSWQWNFAKTIPFYKKFIFDNHDLMLEISKANLVFIKQKYCKNYLNLHKWINIYKPIYTQQSFTKQIAINWNNDEKKLLNFLYHNVPNLLKINI